MPPQQQQPERRNPYAPPGAVKENNRPPTGLGLTVFGQCVLLLIITVAQSLIAAAGVTAFPFTNGIILLLISGAVLLLITLYCGRKYRFRTVAIPLMMGNLCGWGAFVLTIRAFYSRGLTNINVSSKDVPYFIATAIGTSLLFGCIANFCEASGEKTIDQ